jgi:hypothetical protein
VNELRYRSAAGKIIARQRDGQMIQVAIQNKYSLNMQVSARAMAVT